MKPIEYPRNRFAKPCAPFEPALKYMCACGKSVGLHGGRKEIESSLKEAVKDYKLQIKQLQQFLKDSKSED